MSADGRTLAYMADGRLELVWLDRTGTVVGRAADLSGADSANRQLRLSPDESSVAYTGRADLWQFHFRRRTTERLTFSTGPDLIPVWSPGSDRIVFTSNRGNGFDPYVTSAPGAEELLVDLPNQAGWPLDWSRDGKTVLQQSGNDLWTIDVATREAKPYLATPFAETAGSFSPNGHWVAYVSNESGRNQVYLRPFPGPGRQQPVSVAGGTEPAWRDDGRELFYVGEDGTLVAVAIEQDAASITVGESRRLFPGARGYQVARGGERFLLPRRAEPGAITIVLNWQAALSE